MRRLQLTLLGSLFVSFTVLGFLACSSAPTDSPLRVTDEKKRDGAPSLPPPEQQEVPDGADSFLPDGGKPPGRVFAHSSSTLYRYDPLANTIVNVGKFDCVPQDGSGEPGSSAANDAVIDIALDRTGQMYATTFFRFLKVDATTGKCQVIRTDPESGHYPNSLSFVPMGTVDPTRETLVGYAFDNKQDATVYTQIDLATGEMSDLQNLNPPNPTDGVEFGLSGDLISLGRDQGRTFATIKVVAGGAGTGNDLLAEVNPATGTLVRVIGDTGQQSFYGLGFWAGKAYGFTSSGNIYEIDMLTGISKLALAATDQGAPIQFFGAGVTTDSPTAP